MPFEAGLRSFRLWQLLTPEWTAGLPTVPCPKCGGSTLTLYYHRGEGADVEVRVVASCDDRRCEGWSLVGGEGA